MKYFIALLLLASITSNAQPIIKWSKHFGGNSYDEGIVIKKIPNNTGYIIGGSTQSTTNDITNFRGGYDYWIVRVDNIGNIIWAKSFGSSKTDLLRDLIINSSNEIIAIGYSQGADGDVGGNNGNVNNYKSDAWVIKLDLSGNLIWENNFGGSNTDDVQCIVELPGKKYLVVGSSNSNDGDVPKNYNNSDIWVLKVDDSGNLIKSLIYGGNRTDVAYTVLGTQNGGFIIGAITNSNDVDITGLHVSPKNDYDIWLAECDSSGAIIWSRCYGGTKTEGLPKLIKYGTSDYLFCGTVKSIDGDVSPSNDTSGNYWLVKVDGTGNIVWEKTYGGSKSEVANDLISIGSDKKILVVGYSSSNDGDVTGNYNNNGTPDFWLLEVDSNGSIQRQENFGGSSNEVYGGLELSQLGNPILIGSTNSNDFDVPGNYGATDIFLAEICISIDVSIKQLGSALYTDNVSPSYSYQWIDCTTNLPINGAIQPSYTPQKAGLYALVILDSCGVDTSNCLSGIVGVEAINTDVQSFEIYPNPTAGDITIETTLSVSKSEPLLCNIYDITGRLIESKSLSDKTSKLDLKTIDAGMYLVVLRFNNSPVTMKTLIKQ